MVKERGSKRQGDPLDCSTMTSLPPSVALPRRNSPRIAKMLKDGNADETPQSRTPPPKMTQDSLSFHPSHKPSALGSPNANNVSSSSPRRLMPANRGSKIELLARETAVETLALTVEKILPQESPTRTHNLNLTEMDGMCVDCSDDEEVESDPLLVQVHGYRVNAEFAPLLESIFLKHGDIAEDCLLSTAEWRSRCLEACCAIFQYFNEVEFVQLTVEDIKKKIVIVCELEKLNIRVGWLKERLSDILEARQIVKQSSSMKAEKDRNLEFIAEAEKKLKVYELEAEEIGEKIKAAKGELVLAHDKAKMINEVHSQGKAKVRRFYKRSLVNDLI